MAHITKKEQFLYRTFNGVCNDIADFIPFCDYDKDERKREVIDTIYESRLSDLMCTRREDSIKQITHLLETVKAYPVNTTFVFNPEYGNDGFWNVVVTEVEDEEHFKQDCQRLFNEYNVWVIQYVRIKHMNMLANSPEVKKYLALVKAFEASQDSDVMQLVINAKTNATVQEYISLLK